MASTAHLNAIRKLYNSRAETYDQSDWHNRLAEDYITFANIRPGDNLLDLCCGTGLVTLRAAEKVGSTGRVVAIDITDQFLAIAQAKASHSTLANITFYEQDVSNLAPLNLEPHGFNAITCCSAFVLLPDPVSALRSWSQYLTTPSGSIVFDVITETSAASQLLFMEVARRHGFVLHHDRSWVTDKESVERVVVEAGLRVKECWETDAYSEYSEEVEQAGVSWEKMVGSPLNAMAMKGLEGEKERLERAKEEYVKTFEERADADGKWRQWIKLYIVVAIV